MENTDLVRLLNKELATELADSLSYKEIHTRLSARVNELIKNDFEKLLSLLYRIDVSEQKLKSLLQHSSNEDAGNIIATLILERQEQKLKNREQFSQPESDFDGEEKW